MNEQDDEMAEALRDAAGHAYDIGSSSDLFSDMRPPAEQARYDKLFEELHNPMYDDCLKFSTLIVKLINVKVLYKWSDRSFVALLSCYTKLFRLEIIVQGLIMNPGSCFVMWVLGMSILMYVSMIAHFSITSIRMMMFVRFVV